MSASNVLESNKAVTRRFTEEFKNRHNFEVNGRISELWSEWSYQKLMDQIAPQSKAAAE